MLAKNSSLIPIVAAAGAASAMVLVYAFRTRYSNNSTTTMRQFATTSKNRNINTLLQAIDFAAIKHSNQRRKNTQQTPYINHPIHVAYLASQEPSADEEVIIAAVLHDTVEDTQTSLDEIEQYFGQNVRNIVAEVSDDKSLPKEERKRLQIEHASKKSRGAKIVGLADKISNLQDLQSTEGIPREWSSERIQNYAAWAMKVCQGYKGASSILDEQFHQLTLGKFILNGKTYNMLPDDVENAKLV
jgi:(p)ppGpp synthase/HD superfamily hydrolase